MRQSTVLTLLNALFILLTFATTTFSQSGDFILSHHSLNVEGIDNRNFDIKVNQYGQLCIANRSGVLLYDGYNWDYISTPSAALSLDLDDADGIYVGCVSTFGKIDFDDNQIKFIPLNTDSTDQGLYFKTIYKDSVVFFLSEEKMVRYNTLDEKSNILLLPDEEEYYTNLFSFEEQILVQTNKNIYQIEGDSLSTNYAWNFPDSVEFLFFDKHPSENKYIVGTTENEIFLYVDNEFQSTKITKYLSDYHSFVTNGLWIDENHYALSTLEGGILLYDDKSSEIVAMIDDSNGLPDNEIFAIGKDNENGFWISHEYGLSRLEIEIPFKSYTNYQGLEGHIKDLMWHNKNLYVATSQGVFYLNEQMNYKYNVYYVPKKSKSTNTKSNVVAKNSGKTSVFSSKKKKKRVSIFSKKKKSNSKKKEKFTIKKKKKIQYVRRVKRELINSQFVFSKVEGLNHKSEKFLKFHDKVLIATSHGVYELKEETNKKDETTHTAELAIHEPIKFFLKAQNDSTLVVGTHYNEIILYQLENDIWEQIDELDFHGELILGAFENSKGQVWFASPKHLHKFDSLTADSIRVEHQSYPYNNEFIDEVRLTTIKDQLYMINSSGYFYVDSVTQTVKKDTTLWNAIGKPIQHLQEQSGKVWVYNGDHWYLINDDATFEKKDKFDLFPNMSYITNYKDNIWLINQANELLKYFPNNADTLQSKNQMFFRRSQSNKGDIKLNGIATFEHDENSFHFELSKPDYLGLLKVEYQYQIKGQSDSWTEWSSNNQINLNFLPPNTYALTIRSRDAFGTIQESQTIDFIIKPPYWQTLWFYGLQIMFMTGLLFGSVLMSRNATTKYVLVTEGLSILTIVMIIEFLQTITNNYLDIQSTPVVDFGLDVAVALCVFPLEQFLKKFMQVQKQGPGLNGKGIIDILKGA